MTTSATQSDVLKNADNNIENESNIADEVKEPVKSPRELAMEALSVNRNASFEEESGVKLAAPADEDDADDDDDADNKIDQVAAQLNEPKVLTDGLDKIKVRRKIDGVESDVTVEDLLRDNQKHGAADKRLAEATAARAEAQALLQDAKDKQLKSQTEDVSGMANNKDVKKPGAKGASENAKEFLTTLFEGDEDKALEALTKLIEGRQESPILNEAELAKKLTPAIKQQLVVESASKKFSKDYAEIVADPYLASVADDFLEADLKAGKPFDEAIENAGKQTRDWLHAKAGVRQAEPSKTTRNEKLDKKAEIDNVSGTTLKATTVEEPVATASDVIQEMRKARGLQT